MNSSEDLQLLVVIDYHAHSSQLLQWAKKFAKSANANIQAIYVETPRKLTKKEEEQLNLNINLAKHLEIKFRIITSYHVAKAIINFALKEKITQIIIGKPKQSNLPLQWFLIHFLWKLIRNSGYISLLIIGTDSIVFKKEKIQAPSPSFTSRLSQYFTTCFLVLVTSILCFLTKEFIGYQVVSFCLLFLVSVLAIFYGTGPVLAAAVLGAIIWNFFFIQPLYTFHISDPEDILMFLMFFVIALLNGILTTRLRRQEIKIRIREERTHALYQITRELSMASGIEDVIKTVSRHIQKYFNLKFALVLKNEQDQLSTDIINESRLIFGETDINIAKWVFKNGFKAGKYTDRFSSSEFTFYPLVGNNSNIGVIFVKHSKIFTQGEEQFWEACLSHIAGKFEREILRVAAQNAYVLGESDKLYKTLFNSISHELRIPVSTILGATDTLQSQEYPEDTRQKLYNEISIASIRLNRLIENLLNMSRLESGHISIKPDWCDIHDLVNKLLESLGQELTNYKLTVKIAQNIPLVKVDFGILEHILYNLILNAIQYSPHNSQISLNFYYDKNNLITHVSDRGKGFEESEMDHIFEKFYRGKGAKTGGTGLGLSIVKGFVEAHKGSINVINRKSGGAMFTIIIPCESSLMDKF